MELVIKIPEESYKATCNSSMLPPDVENVVNAVKSGTPLPKGHGDLVDRNDLKYEKYNSYAYAIANAPTIIEADKEVMI